jgi:hypothetical protein
MVVLESDWNNSSSSALLYAVLLKSDDKFITLLLFDWRSGIDEVGVRAHGIESTAGV